jgi:phospholipid/cholesterol/gamma-HCH transport system substrate-binding protein
MTPDAEATSPQLSRAGGGFGRLAAIAALILVLIAIIYLLLLSGGGGTKYRLIMETGGQLVTGNQVLIGGVPVGSVDEIKLTDDGRAEVTITVDRPLHEGSEAIVRATSLSGIANRYISIQPGPDNAPVLADSSVIQEVDTTSPVDLDQLFNTLREPERKGLQDIIQGSATVYAGRAEEANETYRYLNPSVVATDRLFQELVRDEQVLADFLVNGANVVSAVAERRDDLSALTSNTNEALGAIARRNESFDRALVALPRALRQANTTFANLRPTLDDLDVLVEASRDNTKNLAPFLRQLKPVLTRSVPVFRDLGRAVNLKGKANDLADATGFLPALQQRAAGAVPITVSAMRNSQPTLQFLRPYMPDLTAGIAHLNAVTGYYDANGHYARVQPAGLGVFTLAGAASPFTFEPQNASDVFDDYGPFGGTNFDLFTRCPGGSTPPIPGSNPFSSPPFPGPPDGAPTTGAVPPASCDATQVVPGP